MVRYDDHAEFQLARRGIDKEWIEETLNDPVEAKGRRMSHLNVSQAVVRCCEC